MPNLITDNLFEVLQQLKGKKVIICSSYFKHFTGLYTPLTITPKLNREQFLLFHFESLRNVRNFVYMEK